MRRIPLLAAVALSACAAPPPELIERISPEALAAEVPQLIPLASVSDVDALLPEDRARVALGLEARAADLRRRAAALRSLPLN